MSNIEEQGETHSPLFMKLRGQSIQQVNQMMESTLGSMDRLEKSINKINTSNANIVSTARIWSSFYDPQVVEKLRKENIHRAD